MRIPARMGSNACAANRAATRAIGAVPDRASALRFITAVALQTTSIRRDHIYLDMSALDPHDAATA